MSLPITSDSLHAGTSTTLTILPDVTEEFRGKRSSSEDSSIKPFKKRFKDQFKDSQESNSQVEPKLQEVINSAKFTKKEADRAQSEKTYLVRKIKDFQTQETRYEQTVAEQAAEIDRLKKQLFTSSLPEIKFGPFGETNHKISVINDGSHKDIEALEAKISSLSMLIKLLKEDDATILLLRKDIAELKQTIQEKDRRINMLEASSASDSNTGIYKQRIMQLEEALNEFIALSQKTLS